MSWTNVLVPLLGEDPDGEELSAAKALAAPFGATVTAAFSSTPVTSLFQWASEAEIGVTDLAIAELERVSSVGEARARDAFAALDYPHKAFENVTSDEWHGLVTASRLADVVVWSPSAACGQGFYAHAFQQILMNERRPALIASSPPVAGGVVALAWDGGRESSRAARRAVPWLQKAKQVLVMTAPHATSRPCDPARLLHYLADNSVPAEPMLLHSTGEVGQLIVQTARDLGVDMLVAGAFGHSRLQRFIFGGTTQVLLESLPAPALFLSH